MPRFEQLTNEDRAKTLAQWFPEHIPGLLDYVKELTDYVVSEPEKVAAEWKPNPIIGPGDWVAYAKFIKEAIATERAKMEKAAGVFADRLFSHMQGLFSCHAVANYAELEQCPPKFSLAIKCLFAF